MKLQILLPSVDVHSRRVLALHKLNHAWISKLYQNTQCWAYCTRHHVTHVSTNRKSKWDLKKQSTRWTFCIAWRPSQNQVVMIVKITCWQYVYYEYRMDHTMSRVYIDTYTYQYHHHSYSVPTATNTTLVHMHTTTHNNDVDKIKIAKPKYTK